MNPAVDPQFCVVRSPNAADAERLAELSAQLGYPSNAEEALKRVAKIQSNPDSALYVAELDGKVVGWINVIARELIQTDRHAEVGGLIVDQNYRGSGVGQALMVKAEDWARENRCRAVIVRSNVLRIAAHNFYEKTGYAVTKSQKVFRKEL